MCSHASRNMNFRRKEKKAAGLEKTALELSDAGKYSYAALCALSLNELFSSEWDMPFSKKCSSEFIERLGLPHQVQETMNCFLTGCTDQSYQAYAEMLLAEPSVQTNPIVVVQDLILFAIKTGQYDARSRVLVMHIGSLLGAPRALIKQIEEDLGHSLLVAARQKSMHDSVDGGLTEEQEELSAKKKRFRRFKKIALVSLAAVGGGALVGLTGGLAAPFIGVGLGAILGTGAVTVFSTVAAAAIIGSLFGLAGAGLTGYRMSRRVGDIEEFEFGCLSSPEMEQQLHIAIAISGWLDEGDANFSFPWRSLRSSKEQYFLKYESQYLLELGNAMNILVKAAMSTAIQHALKFTILRGLLAAIAWPTTLISLSNIIDNPWGTCLRRSAQVGRHLAEVLLSRHHGGRPVTLIGFSLGARVVYYCLRGLIQDAIMLGAPVTGGSTDWEDISTVVAGRVINGYCKTDWLLKFLYRTTNAQVTIAGLNEITCKNPRLKNIDLTDLVAGHMEYASNIDMLLKVVGVRTAEPEVLHLKKCHSEVALGQDEKLSPILRRGQSLPDILDQVDDSEIAQEASEA
ncbi:hypothetical protein B566_EDAN005611 [Ephemera danica]|nr:hypothetical protein B566_EDAN005611 [Ephemera danica]